MTYAIDMTGRTFGRLTVGARSHSDAKGNVCWHCVCACGTSCVVLGFSLRAGKTTSCGCLRRERLSARATVHGHARRGRLSEAYRARSGMLLRCYNPRAKGYCYYGGRGIAVCDAWRESAANFLAYVDAELGPRPPGHSLDRINNNGNYEPGNIRWASRSQQNKNRRTFRQQGAT